MTYVVFRRCSLTTARTVSPSFILTIRLSHRTTLAVCVVCGASSQRSWTKSWRRAPGTNAQAARRGPIVRAARSGVAIRSMLPMYSTGGAQANSSNPHLGRLPPSCELHTTSTLARLHLSAGGVHLIICDYKTLVGGFLVPADRLGIWPARCGHSRTSRRGCTMPRGLRPARLSWGNDAEGVFFLHGGPRPSLASFSAWSNPFTWRASRACSLERAPRGRPARAASPAATRLPACCSGWWRSLAAAPRHHGYPEVVECSEGCLGDQPERSGPAQNPAADLPGRAAPGREYAVSDPVPLPQSGWIGLSAPTR